MAADPKQHLLDGFDVVKANVVPSLVLGLLALVPLLGGACAVNYMVAARAAHRDGAPIELGALFDFEHVVDRIVGPLAVGIAFLFLLAPGALILFAPCVLADRPGVPFNAALEGSFAYHKANLLPSLILAGVCLGVLLVASLCVLPLLLAAPTVCAALMLAYDDERASVEAAAAAAGVQL